MPPTPYLGFGFPPATPNKGLTTSDMPLTRRLILQKARHRPQKGSDGLSTHGFRNYFTPLPGYFSPFPHGTNPLSVTSRYLGLPDGPGRFTADSTSPLLLGQHTNCRCKCFTYRTLTVYGRTFQSTSATPTPHNAGLADPAQMHPHNPTHANPARYHTHAV